MLSLIRGLQRARPKITVGHQSRAARELTNIAILVATAGELAKTLGATSSGMVRVRKIYLVGPRPFRGLIRTEVTIGVLSQGVASFAAMGPLKLRKPIGLCIGTHRCLVNEASPAKATPSSPAAVARATVVGPRWQGSN